MATVFLLVKKGAQVLVVPPHALHICTHTCSQTHLSAHTIKLTAPLTTVHSLHRVNEMNTRNTQQTVTSTPFLAASSHHICFCYRLIGAPFCWAGVPVKSLSRCSLLLVLILGGGEKIKGHRGLFGWESPLSLH